MIPNHKKHPRRPVHLLVALLAWVSATSHGVAAGKSAEPKEFCQTWPQNRLLIDGDLSSRSFLLQGSGAFEPMPSFNASGREIVHRTHTMSLDSIDGLSLFHGKPPMCCLIGRDPERTKAFKIPVFFVGRVGEQRDDLIKDAEKVLFGHSEELDAGTDFADIAFHLRKGGSKFTQIRPFFRCGLPALLVCEGSCPEDGGVALALVSWVAQGKKLEIKRESAPVKIEPPSPSPAADTRYSYSSPTPAQPAPQPQAEPEVKKPEREVLTSPAMPASPPVPLQPAPPQPAAPPAKPQRRLLLTFEKGNGAALSAAEALQAEGGLTIEGVQLQATSDGLAVDMPEDAFQRASDPANLTKMFRQHRILSAKPQGERILLTVEPLYIRADDLSIKIQDANQDAFKNCAVALDVDQQRRLGSGWAKMAPEANALIFSYFTGEAIYKLELPSNIAENELLISTDAPGSAARISNSAPRCGLEAKPLVTAEELRTLVITRSLRESGPILIALVTTDSAFASTVGNGAESYWLSALDLVNSVSKGTWEKKILARAQGPGVTAATAIIGEASGAADLNDPAGERGRRAELLAEGSRTKLGARAIIQFEPIERFHLDVVLQTIRTKAGILAPQSAQQEALLLISGSVRKTGSDFCRRAIRGEVSGALRPQWLKQARRALILEVWSETAVEALQKDQRAEPVEGAPSGVYRCKIGGADGDKVKLYGIGLSTLLDNAAREAAFSYLTAEAQGFLKP